MLDGEMNYRSSYYRTLFAISLALQVNLGLPGCRQETTDKEREVIAWASQAEVLVIPSEPVSGSGGRSEQRAKEQAFLDGFRDWIAKGKSLPEAEEILLRCLDDEHPAVQPAVAIFALGVAVGSERSVPVLIKYAGGSRNPDVIADVCDALGRIGSPAAVPFLRKLLFESPDSAVRIEAAGALAMIMGKKSLDLIKARLRKIDAYERNAKIKTGDIQRERRFLNHLVSKLEAKDWRKSPRWDSLFSDMRASQKK